MAKKNIKYTPPEWLEKEAKEYISDVVKELNCGQNLKKIDLAGMNMLAISYSTFVTSSKTLAEEGTTYTNYRGDPVKHPAVNIANDAQAKAVRLLIEYGLTPKSREAIAGINPPDEDSPLDAFIKGNKKQ